MYSETIEMSAGESLNAATRIPPEAAEGAVTVISGQANLDGIDSNYIIWVNPCLTDITITAITDCVVVIYEVNPEPELP